MKYGYIHVDVCNCAFAIYFGADPDNNLGLTDVQGYLASAEVCALTSATRVCLLVLN